MASPESIVLIRKARDGDRTAWEALCKRYYPQWLKQLHGKIGNDLRNLCETVDLVQSALAYAFPRIEDLESDACFFSWVTAIGRRKIYAERRKAGKRRKVHLDGIAEVPATKASVAAQLHKEEDCERVLDAVLGLFEKYPVPMAMIYLKYYHKQKIDDLVAIFGKSDRTVERLLKDGLKLIENELKKRETKG